MRVLRIAAASLLAFSLSSGPSRADDDTAASDDGTQLRQAHYAEHALTHAGNPQRGRRLFRDRQRTQCIVCHRVDGEGGEVGPDLTHIGGKFDRPHLIESLLEPSRQIVEGYETVSVLTQSGRVHSGVIQQQNETQITLVDPEGKTRSLRREAVEEMSPSSVSLMPEDLEQSLSAVEFTDLVAYLESLRPANSKQGAGIAGPISLPDGFAVRTVATGLSGATALEVLPDGRVLVCEQPGAVRVVDGDRLLEEPLIRLPVEVYWERGVIGVTCDPQFPRKPFVYVCWVAKNPYPHHRVSRFTVEGNIADPASEKVLLVGDDQTKMGGKVPAGHQGGALHFGPDGKLYIGIGEQTAGQPSQRLDTFLGKILRINPDGSIPEDNPFVDQAEGKYRAIWARGCRNPFTFAFRRSDGLMLINDVGGKFEEINIGRAGANYGWPAVEHGDRPAYRQQEFQGPIHQYPQSSINGGDFCPAGSPWPVTWHGRYFFADFVHGWINTIDPDDPEKATSFGNGFRRPVDLRFAADGGLYVLLRNAWVIDDKFQRGTGSLLKVRHTRGAGAGGEREPSVTLSEGAVDPSAGGLPAYRIQTRVATYFLEKSGAGLSSLLDADGNDWIGFHPEPGSGAGGEYRGIPNAVHQQAGNYFHPKNAATDRSTTRVQHEGRDRVTIAAEAENGLWACRYDFFPTHCTFTMTRMPQDKRYWFLYEGTPGGKTDADDWWIASGVSEKQPLVRKHHGDLRSPEWIAFGDESVGRVLFFHHHQDDDHPDEYYQMQRKMTVFGFGRRGLDKFLSSTGHSFSFGFLESTDRAMVQRQIRERHGRLSGDD